MDKIKQQKIKLDTDERNSTNNKNENDILDITLSLMDRIYKIFGNKFFSDKQSEHQQFLNNLINSNKIKI